jgi:glycosyltransferase involved in cell wall biosynthesis
MSALPIQFPKVAIVIPTYNSATTILQSIEACLRQEYEGEIEVIVVDDGSTDQTSSMLSQYSNVHFIRQRNCGPAKARNTGWKSSKSDLICFTDSDCVPHPHWVRDFIPSFENQQVGGVGGSYNILNHEFLLAKCIQEEIYYRHKYMPKKAAFLGSYNACFRRKILEQVGGFDESFRMASGEDNDLSYKVSNLGYTLIFDPHNTVGHYHPTKLWKYYRRQLSHGYWRMKIYKNHPNMTRGDGYSSPSDFIQPPLSLILLGLLPFFWLPKILLLSTFLLGILIFLQIPMVSSIMKNTKDSSYIVLIPMIIGRGFARGIGMVVGIIHFFLLKN